MLVLTRKVLQPSAPEETVVFRDKTTGEIIARIGVIKVSPGRIKLGIEASQSIEVKRGETVGEEGYIRVELPHKDLLKAAKRNSCKKSMRIA